MSPKDPTPLIPKSEEFMHLIRLAKVQQGLNYQLSYEHVSSRKVDKGIESLAVTILFWEKEEQEEKRW